MFSVAVYPIHCSLETQDGLLFVNERGCLSLDFLETDLEAESDQPSFGNKINFIVKMRALTQLAGIEPFVNSEIDETLRNAAQMGTQILQITKAKGQDTARVRLTLLYRSSPEPLQIETQWHVSFLAELACLAKFVWPEATAFGLLEYTSSTLEKQFEVKTLD